MRQTKRIWIKGNFKQWIRKRREFLEPSQQMRERIRDQRRPIRCWRIEAEQSKGSVMDTVCHCLKSGEEMPLTRKAMKQLFAARYAGPATQTLAGLVDGVCMCTGRYVAGQPVQGGWW
jgi:hypothetical protein